MISRFFNWLFSLLGYKKRGQEINKEIDILVEKQKVKEKELEDIEASEKSIDENIEYLNKL